jgi:hypothetical protein
MMRITMRLTSTGTVTIAAGRVDTIAAAISAGEEKASTLKAESRAPCQTDRRRRPGAARTLRGKRLRKAERSPERVVGTIGATTMTRARISRIEYPGQSAIRSPE